MLRPTLSLALSLAIACGSSVPARASDRDSACFTAVQPLHKVDPDYPDAARRDRAAGTAKALVRVAADGSATAEIVKSSGNAALDAATLAAARASTYAPATERCKPVDDVWLYVAVFDAQ